MIICPGCHYENIDGNEECENCGIDLTHLSRPKATTPVAKALHKQVVSSLRSHPPIVVPGNRKVRDVIASMVLHNDGCAIVLNDKGSIAGVFSERDLLNKIVGQGEGLLDHKVEEFMTEDPVVIKPDHPIAYALHQMDLGGYRHLPLVEDGLPVGMVSIRDILLFIANRVLGEESDAPSRNPSSN